MPEQETHDGKVTRLLWDSLEGGDYDMEALKGRLLDNARFDEAGIDSLDLGAFLLRVQDHFNITIRQEEYPALMSLADVQAYLRRAGASS